ncbi:hypothetical protein L228DRAFT_237872 [Xylona heveae TC161]|uniref:Uncharacterized protein n=1 Tax=Xylona heveae (strain CBS 132557 / TC161) TaxID=1328760 RepID=A0A165HCC9_XYLHT|nr:hypothetical protein L228DRAFT_237872 [Xylona heveae TC161]KZF23291.1 hypothetical protein L228DRAFT_237872 [Xylona heveae TC161]
MRFQYTSEQLLRLRDSPLVCKPENLPPIEEWMGPPPEPTPRKPSMHRARTDDATAFGDSPNRRPPMFSRGQSAVPDDIVLGPPKTSFASATSMRNFGKSTDSPERSLIASIDDDTPRNDRYNLREKFFKEREKLDRDNEKPPRELRSGFSNNRRVAREDGDNWSGLGRSRGLGQEDTERFSRRNGERDREGSTPFRERGPRQHEGYGKDRDDADREHQPRRTGFGRGRNEPSWFKDDNAQGTRDKEGIKESVRDREWRDRDRRDDREWIKGTRVDRADRAEHNPEWMETSTPFEKKQTHTQEDLQKWKERMKASAASATSTPKEEVEQQSILPERPASGLVKGDIAKPDSPIIMDNSFDKFLGLWNEPTKRAESASSESSPALAKKETKGGKASRFTSFFAPQDDVPYRASEQPSLAASPSVQKDESSSEDKQAFQRILQMLGGSSINSGTSTPHGPPPGPADDSSQPLSASAVSPTRPPPGLQSLFSHSRQSSGAINPKGAGSQPSRGSTPANKDSEFLLKLMQQSRSPPAVSEQSPPAFRGVGVGGPPQPLDLQGAQRPMDDVAKSSKSPGGFPLPLFDQLQGHHRPPPPPSSERRDINENVADGARKKGPPGPPPGFFDDPLAGFARRPPIDSPQRGPSIPPPPGLQRPPGLDNMPPQPNWQGNPLPPPQQGIAPPPGFGISAMRGPNPFPPSGIMPHPPPPPPNMPMFGNERGAGPVPVPVPVPGPGPGPGPANAGGPLPHPNMPPPPLGFFGINGPLPPGFPPIPPYSPEGLMGLSGPAGLPAGNGRRPPFDMFADVGPAAGVNGRGAPPDIISRYNTLAPP